jgi:hypothetical protein
MRCIGAQEGRDVRSTRQLVEAPLLDCLEVGATDFQALLDRGKVESARFALIAQQATYCTTRRGFAFQRTPIDLIRHDVPC